jgi:uncharacterized protein YbjT (DUF2867 family)
MIVVIGGTGRLGGIVAGLLRADGFAVRVVTRSQARAAALRSAGADAVVADLRHPDSLRAALRGADAVVCTAHGSDAAGADGPRQVDGAGIANLVAALRERPARNLVYVMAASARPDSPAEFFRLKAAAEDRIRGSGLPHSIIRPTHLMDTWFRILGETLARRGRAMVLGSGTNPISFVAAADVAQVTATLAAADGHGATLDLGGPEPLTLNQANDLLAAALGIQATRPVRIPVGVLRTGGRFLGSANELTARRMQLGALLASQPQILDSADTWHRYRITPADPRSWLARNLPGLKAEWQASSTATKSEAS